MDTATIGQVLVWAATAAAALAVLPRLGRLLGLGAALASVATAVLGWALVTLDFSLDYVAQTTSFATPWPYRLAAVWGGMEGSMLFYAALSLSLAWVGLRHRPIARSVGAGLGAALMAFTAASSNPFRALELPAVDGQGLLALLQHPAMIYHPPILYLGLTTLVVPFALTVDAVLRDAVDRDWVRSARRWLLVSWTFLTLGMVAGANWAYVELGWGGYWAWDPVENTALMPWLATTIFLHTSRVFERDGRLRRWCVASASLPFALTVLGVYLTRSGSTGSIHSFAEDPVIGRILLVAAIGAAALVVAVAARAPGGEPWGPLGPTRDTWLCASGVLVSVILVFVTVGSAYPAYVQVFSGDEVSVGSGFFVTSIYPIALLIALALGLAFHTAWSGSGVTRRDLVRYAVSGVIVAAVAIALSGTQWAPMFLIAASAGAIVLLARSLAATRPRGAVLAGHLAHLGLAMVLVGAGGSSLGAEFGGVMAPGDQVDVGGRRVTLSRIETGEAERFIYVRATFLVDGRPAEPEIRAYEDQRAPVAEPALLTNPAGDVVIAISTVSPDASWVEVAVFVRPMVWWVWLGALLMAVAGALGLSARDGDGGGRRRRATEERQSAGTAIGKSAP